jgi:signal transduction histidine kinase
MQPVELHPIVEEELRLLETNANTKQNQCLNQVPVHCSVMGDKHILRFVLRNLLNNANKFTTGGTISVSAKKEKHHIRIAVTDTGIGMSEEIRRHLFNPRFRASSPGTASEKGNGLGLMLIGEFMQLLNSELTIDSEPGKGTSIAFTLPLTT